MNALTRFSLITGLAIGPIMQHWHIRTSVRVLASGLFLAWAFSRPAVCQTPSEIYQQRIIPLLKSETGSSCRECHFQAVDLKEFMSEDPAATFAALRARGWIDVNEPEKSKLLGFVARSSESTNPLQAKVRQSEHAALTQWIIAASRDKALLAVPVKQHDDLQLDGELIRHTRKDQLLDRFVTTVWSQLERCANCHSPDRNAKQVAKNGEQMSWIVPQSPERTLTLLRERKLIDFDEPKRSLIRTKPLALVEHGAGIKFPEGGETDAAWTGFLEDAVRTWKADYRSSKELPLASDRRSWRTGLHLRISALPESTVGELLTIVLLRESSQGKSSQGKSSQGKSSQGRSSQGESLPIAAYAESRVQAAGSWGNSLSIPLTQVEWRKIDAIRPPAANQLLAASEYRLVVYRCSAVELFKAMEAGHIDQLATLANSKVNAPWESGHANSLQLKFPELTQPVAKSGARE